MLAPEILGKLVLVLCKLQFSIFEYFRHVLLLGDLDHAFVLHFTHLLRDLLDLLLDILPFRSIINALADIDSSIHEILVKVVREHRVRLGKVVAC